jgi:hypothetical protein
MFKLKSTTFLQCPEGAGRPGHGSGGSKTGSAESPSWVPFDASPHGAEKPVTVRAANCPETVVVVTQHGQIVRADTRRLLGWKPEEQLAG